MISKIKLVHITDVKIDRACSLRRTHVQYFIDKRLNDHTSYENGSLGDST